MQGFRVERYNGQIALSEIRHCFLSSWQSYVDLYKSIDPRLSAEFDRYSRYTVSEGDFSDIGFPIFLQAHCLFVAVDDAGLLCGMVAAELQDSAVELKRLCVSPQHRQKGLARLLDFAVFRFGAIHKKREIVLSTGDAMVFAQRLYSKLQYQVRRREYSAVHQSMIVHFARPISKTDRKRFFNWELTTHFDEVGFVVIRHREEEVGRVAIGATAEEQRKQTEKLRKCVKKELRQGLIDHYRRKGETTAVIFGKRTKIKEYKPKDFEIVALKHPEKLEKVLRKLFAGSWITLLDLWRGMDEAMYDLLKVYVENMCLDDDLRNFAQFDKMFIARHIPSQRVVGMVGLLKGGELKRLAVLPAARGMGIASRLVGKCEDYCRPLYHYIFLTTGSFMPFATRLYHKLEYDLAEKILLPTFRKEILIFKFEKHL